DEAINGKLWLSDHLAVEVDGGEPHAKYLAHKYNLHYVRQVFTNPPVYHFHNMDSNDNRKKRSTNLNVINLLAQEPKHNTGQLGHAGYDLNVTWAWLRGYTGRGVHLSILDDGIQTTNADIAANYFPDISYSVIHDGQPLDDPSPRIDPSFSNSHGTYCAAIVAAVPNNSVCGVGVAYEAKVGEFYFQVCV
ncbi:hypothetical protein OTU49_001182, partial [Cherax quadricarinatus]